MVSVQHTIYCLYDHVVAGFAQSHGVEDRQSAIWALLKHLKTGKGSHLSSEKVEKQATVYRAPACIDRIRPKTLKRRRELHRVV